MKPWNAHMEHVIEWKTVSCWIETAFWRRDGSMRDVQALVFLQLLFCLQNFYLVSPFESSSRFLLEPNHVQCHEPVFFNTSQNSIKDLIKSGKDLFSGVGETGRLAERLALMLLLLLSSSLTSLLPRWVRIVILVSLVHHNYAATYSQSHGLYLRQV